ncbi:MAG: hypothetical protein U1C58_09110 [Flavobacteriaceae bacterium]|nr:hypothetical protein [Flavobacteriaceae bacterium]MDZ4148429.1 hypothetical protein [Flavobacteriaceae bacterium]
MVKSKKKQPGKFYLNLLEVFAKEKLFLLIILIGILLAEILTGYGQAAMWLGFAFAAYAAVSNDSIQSLGTFIESNGDKKWWILWLYVGAIFLATVTFSWIYFDGDVTYQRLVNAAGETQFPHPDNFSIFQIIAPLVLLIITRLRMPVSTTFLLLSVFSADSSGIISMVGKSVSGYVLAFILSFVVWYSSYKLIQKFFKKRKSHPAWMPIQWVVSGALWSVWVMQDGANIAVFLPRQQTAVHFAIFATTIFLGLGILFYLRGDKIQQVVSEKIRISDIRAATLIDFTYVILLIYKLFISPIPMSTTWVFLGVIGGREIAISLSRTKSGEKHKKKAFRLIAKDFIYALIGLAISVVLASGANKAIRDEVFSYFTNLF